MNWNIFMIGIMATVFLYVSNYKAFAVIAFLIFLVISAFSKSTSSKSAHSGKMLEPIIVESPNLTWGSGVKQMPKEIWKFEESKEFPAGEKKIWGSPLGGGIAGWIGRSIGKLFKED